VETGFIEGMTVVAQDGSRFRETFPGGRGALIRRERLDAILLRRAEQCGVEIVEGFRVDTVTVNDSVEVRNEPSGRALRARLLIAADGMRSIAAQRLGLLPSLPDGRFTVGAYFGSIPGPPAGELFLGGGLYGGVARFGDSTANVCLALPRALFRGRTPDEAFEQGVRALPSLREAMRTWTRESPFRVTGPLGFSRHPVVADRAMLAGDAAGQVEPLTGQGISFALRSGLLAAESAARALTSGDLSTRALRPYAQRRAAVLGPKIRMMRLISALAVRSRVTPALVRRLAAHPDLARRLLGATGDLLGPHTVLSPHYAIRLLLGLDAHQA
jgi:flavin-dependent dehydrogenase